MPTIWSILYAQHAHELCYVKMSSEMYLGINFWTCFRFHFFQVSIRDIYAHKKQFFPWSYIVRSENDQ